MTASTGKSKSEANVLAVSRHRGSKITCVNGKANVLSIHAGFGEITDIGEYARVWGCDPSQKFLGECPKFGRGSPKTCLNKTLGKAVFTDQLLLLPLVLIGCYIIFSSLNRSNFYLCTL